MNRARKGGLDGYGDGSEREWEDNIVMWMRKDVYAGGVIYINLLGQCESAGYFVGVLTTGCLL